MTAGRRHATRSAQGSSVATPVDATSEPAACGARGMFGFIGYGNTNDMGDDEVPAAAGDVPLGGTAIHIAVGTEATCALLDIGNVRC